MTSRLEQQFGWPVTDHVLRLGQHTLHGIAEQCGTPFYAYDLNAIRRRARQLKAAFPGFELLYSIKSNPNRDICALLANEGFGAGVSSGREIPHAIRCGYKASAVGFVGPGKTDDDLDLAIRRKVGVVYAESSAELHRLADIAARRKRRVRVALRVNTRHRPSSAGELMAGGPSPFGIDEESLGTVVSAMDRKWLRLVGIHTFVASQVMDSESLFSHFERVADLAANLSRDLGFTLELVNFGGGFGVPYGRAEYPLDVDKLGQRVANYLSSSALASSDGVQCVLEVGRYLVAEAGLFVARVVEVKQSRGTTFVITDSGISGFARPAMPWAQQHPCNIPDRIGARPTETCKVVGPSCMPGDVLCESAELPEPVPGDLVVLHNAGAYGLSMSMVNWGSFPSPREVVLDGEQVTYSDTPAPTPRSIAHRLKRSNGRTVIRA